MTTLAACIYADLPWFSPLRLAAQGDSSPQISSRIQASGAVAVSPVICHSVGYSLTQFIYYGYYGRARAGTRNNGSVHAR